MKATATPAMDLGIAYALGAYLMWGLFPLYFHALAAVAPLEMLAHRIAWSLVTMLALLLALRRLRWIATAFRDGPTLLHFAISASLVSLNWLIYIWAVDRGRVVDASLGYFINPLVNVLLARLFLNERLRRGQAIAVGVAGLGVAWLTLHAGAPPWIALALAVSFALYGLMRRSASLGAIEGFSMETALLAPVALAYLAWLQASEGLVLVQTGDRTTQALIVAAGPITTVPLLLFAAGARRIPFSMLGVLQFVTPTLQWLLGVFAFHEAFDATKAVGFVLIWAALVLFATERLWSPPPRDERAGAR